MRDNPAPRIARELAQTLYGEDIYAGFVPILAEDLQGWNSEAPIFREIVRQHRPTIIVDVGTWKGGSTIFLASLLREHGIDGVVVAVDTFLGSAEHWAQGMSSLLGRRHGHPLLYEQFLTNVHLRGVQDYVVPLPQTSEVAASLLRGAGIRPGLVHIDASHDYASVLRDIRDYWDILAAGGWLVGDDYHPTWSGVVRAADEFAAEIGIDLQVQPPKWILQKPAQERTDLASRRPSMTDPSTSLAVARAALLDGRFEDAGTAASRHFGDAPKFDIRRARTDQPFSVATWYVEAANRSVIVLSDQIPPPRMEFFATRLILSLPLLAAYHQSAACAPGAIHLSLDDNAAAPGLGFCAQHPHIALIPDPVFLRTLGYQSTRASFAANDIPWEHRRPVAFWRGATTGRRAGSGWRTLPRIRLCEIANWPEVADLFDVGISNIGQLIDARESKEISATGLMRDYVPIEDSIKYRFQIDIDGNTSSWPGLFQKLCTGSTVLKVASPEGFRQWYYDRLEPWRNFVPVAADMSDLVDKVRWLLAHDNEAREIGRRGRELADRMTYEAEIGHGVQTITDAMQRSFAGGEVAIDLDFGLAGNARGYLGDGWSGPEPAHVWSVGERSLLHLPPLKRPGRYCLEIEGSGIVARPFVQAQRLSVRVNGVLAAELSVANHVTLAIPVPAAAIEPSRPLTIEFLHPCHLVPAEHGISNDPRALAVAFARLRLIRAYAGTAIG